jgi:hypothetical protein
LTGTIPTAFSAENAFPSLRQLDLSKNRISGAVCAALLPDDRFAIHTAHMFNTCVAGALHHHSSSL